MKRKQNLKVTTIAGVVSTTLLASCGGGADGGSPATVSSTPVTPTKSDQTTASASLPSSLNTQLEGRNSSGGTVTSIGRVTAGSTSLATNGESTITSITLPNTNAVVSPSNNANSETVSVSNKNNSIGTSATSTIARQTNSSNAATTNSQPNAVASSNSNSNQSSTAAASAAKPTKVKPASSAKKQATNSSATNTANTNSSASSTTTSNQRGTGASTTANNSTSNQNANAASNAGANNNGATAETPAREVEVSTPTIDRGSFELPDVSTPGAVAITPPKVNNGNKLTEVDGFGYITSSVCPVDLRSLIACRVDRNAKLEVLHSDSYYEKYDYNTSKATKTIEGKAVPTTETFTEAGIRLASSDSATVDSHFNLSRGSVNRNSADLGLGQDKYIYNVNFNVHKFNKTVASGGKLIVNNPKVEVNYNSIKANGAAYYYGVHLGNNPIINPNSKTSINELLYQRIKNGSKNLEGNYRFYSLKGLQKQIGTSVYTSNPADYIVYDLATEAKFIPTYLGLTKVRHLLYQTSTALEPKTVSSLTNQTFEERTDLLNGNNVKVAMLDLAINKDHPSLARATLVEDRDNWNKKLEIQNLYKQQTGKEFPEYHGTQVALIIAGKSSKYQRQYQGIAPRAKLTAYELVLDNTKISDVFKKAYESKQSVFNASFHFGLSDRENNRGVLEELNRQALDWKNAPLYVFATGNRERVNDNSHVSATLNNLVYQQTSSPISLAVTGVNVDQTEYAKGFTDTRSLKLNSLAIPCGTLAANCLAGFFINKTSDPTIQGNTYSQDTGVKVYGTSFAAPQVTGVAAITKQMFPWMTANNLRQTLLTTATDLGDPGVDEVYGWGLVNAEKAIKGPAAFAFGDFIVDIEADRLRNSGLDYNRNFYFTNNIVGDHGLSYYNDTGYRLYLTGTNTYKGATKVTAGKLVLLGGQLVSPVEISARGAFYAQNNASVINNIANYGYLNLSNSTISGNIQNYGTTILNTARIAGNFNQGKNAILTNFFDSRIQGNLTLASDSVFLTNLNSTLTVDGKASIDGAIGIQNTKAYVPKAGYLHLVLSAGSFEANKKRFKEFYRQLDSDFGLLNYDLVYDDTNANVYVLYRQKSSANQDVTNQLNASHSRANNGISTLSSILSQAEHSYKRTAKTVNAQNSLPTVTERKALISEFFRMFPESKTLPTSNIGGSSNNKLSGIDLSELEAQVTLALSEDTESTTESAKASKVKFASSKKSRLTSAILAGLEEDTASSSNFSSNVSDSDILAAATKLQNLSTAELAKTAIVADASIFADAIVTNQYVNQIASRKVLSKTAESVKSWKKDWEIIAEGHAFGNHWRSNSELVNSKLSAVDSTVAAIWQNYSYAIGLGYMQSKTNWSEGFSDTPRKSFSRSTANTHALAASFAKSTSWGGFEVEGVASLTNFATKRSVFEDNDLAASFKTYSGELGFRTRYLVSASDNYQIDAHLGVKSKYTRIGEINEQAASDYTKAFAFKTKGSSFNNIYASVGLDYTRKLDIYGVRGKIKTGIEFVRNLTGKQPHLVNQNNSASMSDPFYQYHNLVKYGFSYNLNLPNNWELSLGLEGIANGISLSFTGNVGFSVKF